MAARNVRGSLWHPAGGSASHAHNRGNASCPAACLTAEPSDEHWSSGPIRLSLGDPEQLFNSIDPSPFGQRDLDERAERFIVDWARELKSGATLALEVSLPADVRADRTDIAQSVQADFRRRQDTGSRELRELVARGRVSLVIGLVFLTGCVVAADALSAIVGHRFRDVLREGLTVAGWVAMWRPMEIFLYECWPLAGERKLYRRLAAMPVQVVIV